MLIIKEVSLVAGHNYRAMEAAEKPRCVGVEQRGAVAELSQSLRWLPG